MTEIGIYREESRDELGNNLTYNIIKEFEYDSLDLDLDLSKPLILLNSAMYYPSYPLKKVITISTFPKGFRNVFEDNERDKIKNKYTIRDQNE